MCVMCVSECGKVCYTVYERTWRSMILQSRVHDKFRFRSSRNNTIGVVVIDKSADTGDTERMIRR